MMQKYCFIHDTFGGVSLDSLPGLPQLGRLSSLVYHLHSLRSESDPCKELSMHVAYILKG